ncbi:hypothetical protein SAMN05660226_00171 [Parapedobacter luteus]|uniref:DUF3299 domain-containing protein n=1 Tax=Parapedobacter luteus TaxID=623280 RepID=A0A1T4ZWP9_9SPHI|nr:hypothetical protein [Parapedobacter luteus]SKB26783.1 hypothetical protein SAMN05660226_00171 [Parapedobacter luteus]
MKKLLLLFLCGLPLQQGLAQSPHDGQALHEGMMNATWRAINNATNSGNGNGTFGTNLSAEIRALSNKVVNLAGYVIPIESGRTHKRFMLSVLPIMQCMFCGQDGIPPMIEVMMKDRAVPYSDFPVELKGRLYLKESADGSGGIQLLDAELY